VYEEDTWQPIIGRGNRGWVPVEFKPLERCFYHLTSKNILIIIELLSYRSNPLLWIDHVGTYV
jgi:hypothetical protein